MSPPDFSTAASETSIDEAVIERVADRSAALTGEELADALVVVHAELIGRHSEYERTADYVTDDGVRAYRVEESAWDDLADAVDLGGEELPAVRAAHTEQARLMFSAAADAGDDFRSDQAGVVVGIDTAEQF
jgi:hypothetical protein